MQQKWTADQIAVVYMTTRLNQARLDEDPPIAHTTITDGIRKAEMESGLKIVGQFWDQYRDVVQISFLNQGECSHFMVCDEQTNEDDEPVKMVAHGNITTFADEDELVRAALNYIGDLGKGTTPNGAPLMQFALAGWHVGSDIWPVLVNRAMRYRLPVVSDMLCGLDVKWPASRRLLDVATIYTQGAGSFRKMPRLLDVLKFWGTWPADDDGILPEDMGSAVCDDPVSVARSVEPYLRGMASAIDLYSNGFGAEQPSPLEAFSAYDGPVWPI